MNRPADEYTGSEYAGTPVGMVREAADCLIDFFGGLPEVSEEEMVVAMIGIYANRGRETTQQAYTDVGHLLRSRGVDGPKGTSNLTFDFSGVGQSSHPHPVV